MSASDGMIVHGRAESSSSALLKVRSLGKRYGDQHALSDISFDARAREVVGLIGPNGAGKTTLLEALAGLAKLRRSMPNVTIRLAGRRQSFTGRAGDDAYGETELVYGARSDTTRSTDPREFLRLLYQLAGVNPPAAAVGDEYPGYPLVADGEGVLGWYFGGLPLLIVLAWWWSRRPPSIHHGRILKEVKP